MCVCDCKSVSCISLVALCDLARPTIQRHWPIITKDSAFFFFFLAETKDSALYHTDAQPIIYATTLSNRECITLFTFLNVI